MAEQRGKRGGQQPDEPKDDEQPSFADFVAGSQSMEEVLGAQTVTLTGIVLRSETEGKFTLAMAGGQTMELDTDAVSTYRVVQEYGPQRVVELEMPAARVPGGDIVGGPNLPKPPFAETIKEALKDPLKEAIKDPIKDPISDTGKEPPFETLPHIDTGKEPPFETLPQFDTGKEPPFDTHPRLDKGKDPPFDTIPQLDKGKDPPQDTSPIFDKGKDIVADTLPSVDVFKDPSRETLPHIDKGPPADTLPQFDTHKEGPYDTPPSIDLKFAPKDPVMDPIPVDPQIPIPQPDPRFGMGMVPFVMATPHHAATAPMMMQRIASAMGGGGMGVGGMTPAKSPALDPGGPITIKELPQDTLKEQPIDTIKEQPWDTLKEQPWDTLKEQPWDTLKEQPWDTLKEQPWDTLKESVWDTVFEQIGGPPGGPVINPGQPQQVWGFPGLTY